MITLENLTKSFPTPNGRKYVARDVNLTIPKGKSLALLGRNGAGKSTMLQMISGTMNPDSGRIHSSGNVSFPVGFAGSFHRDLTGAQNARFVARIYGVDTDELLDFVADFAALGGHLNMPVRSYSSGMRSRLAFGISMALKFDTYLVDEVTSVGDSAFRRKSAAIFKARMLESNAIVVTHSLIEVRNLCNAGAVLENGEVTYFDDVEEAIALHVSNMKRAK
ncbi:putative cell surface polysaccharide export ABC-2 transporter ATP-binding protein [Roseobacter sp. SK209-2-6]|uniref:ABC transporter ATP-binding protein n=1 Tax=Roseobacter sp. SK209-2-6 TaxID=388739 RepID=UPI0000F3F227|nr:ABC transporter ATP-binding protein [Roseobacter sp. SK209-2-6]EBA14533.1 putative cell surface polysaccharide export ABC-2 transporter ATP-binding protein [Roseobacter sp. SK209-2-6]